MKHIPLSEVVAELESGSRPKGGVADKGGDIPSLGAEHLDDSGHFKLDKLKLVPRDFFDQMRSGHIYQKDILIVKDGATTGKTSFVDESFPCEDAAINEHVFRLAIEARKAFPKYVFRFLHSPVGLQQILKDFRGATVGGISRGFTDKVSLPFPSLTEQKRIAAILDRADAIRRKRRQAIQLVDEFLRSVFFDMFGNPSSNPKNWKTTSIKSFGKVVTGNTPSRKQPEYYGDHIEWIKSDNINTPSHFLTPASEYLSESGRAAGRTAPAGSILVTCIAGSHDCIGNVALADREVAFNQQINAIIPNDNVNKWFLYGQILYAKSLIQSASTNSMKGMVSKSKFEQIELINPPERLQCKFGDIFQKHSELEANLRMLHGKSQETFSSISQRAFRGDL